MLVFQVWGLLWGGLFLFGFGRFRCFCVSCFCSSFVQLCCLFCLVFVCCWIAFGVVIVSVVCCLFCFCFVFVLVLWVVCFVCLCWSVLVIFCFFLGVSFRWVAFVCSVCLLEWSRCRSYFVIFCFFFVFVVCLFLSALMNITVSLQF